MYMYIMYNFTHILLNLIILGGIGLFISQTFFFARFTGGGSARHLRGCLGW